MFFFFRNKLTQERENMVLIQNKIIEFQKQKHHLSCAQIQSETDFNERITWPCHFGNTGKQVGLGKLDSNMVIRGKN